MQKNPEVDEPSQIIQSERLRKGSVFDFPNFRKPISTFLSDKKHHDLELKIINRNQSREGLGVDVLLGLDLDPSAGSHWRPPLARLAFIRVWRPRQAGYLSIQPTLSRGSIKKSREKSKKKGRERRGWSEIWTVGQA